MVFYGQRVVLDTRTVFASSGHRLHSGYQTRKALPKGARLNAQGIGQYQDHHFRHGRADLRVRSPSTLIF
jgi:hypothetical protein